MARHRNRATMNANSSDLARKSKSRPTRNRKRAKSSSTKTSSIPKKLMLDLIDRMRDGPTNIPCDWCSNRNQPHRCRYALHQHADGANFAGRAVITELGDDGAEQTAPRKKNLKTILQEWLDFRTANRNTPSEIPFEPSGKNGCTSSEIV